MSEQQQTDKAFAWTKVSSVSVLFNFEITKSFYFVAEENIYCQNLFKLK